MLLNEEVVLDIATLMLFVAVRGLACKAKSRSFRKKEVKSSIGIFNNGESFVVKVAAV